MMLSQEHVYRPNDTLNVGLGGYSTGRHACKLLLQNKMHTTCMCSNTTAPLCG